MKKTLFLTLLAVLTLAGCQDKKAPTAKTSVQAVASVTEANKINSSDHRVHLPESQQATMPVKNAVAVTKPDSGGIAKRIHTAMNARKIENLLATIRTAPIHKPDVVARSAAKVDNLAVVSKPATTALSKMPVKQVVMVGDAVKGKVIAQKCQMCHHFTAKKKLGPGLKGVFGRKAGIMPDMKYSKSLAAGGWVWDEEHLNMWDCDSKKAIKAFTGDPSAKTRMPAQHICDAHKLTNLIAFLKTL